jgi:hypothetical protein
MKSHNGLFMTAKRSLRPERTQSQGQEMEEAQAQHRQQHQQELHGAVVRGIRRREDPLYREQRLLRGSADLYAIHTTVVVLLLHYTEKNELILYQLT